MDKQPVLKLPHMGGRVWELRSHRKGGSGNVRSQAWERSDHAAGGQDVRGCGVGDKKT